MFNPSADLVDPMPGGESTSPSDIAAGTMRALFGGDDPDPGCWIVTRPGMLRPSARAFVAWVRRQSDTLSQPRPRQTVK